MKKIKTTIALLLAFSMGTATVPSLVMTASAENNPLDKYQTIIDEFNLEYGTEYQFATKEIIESEGSSIEEMTDFFTSMSEEEFYEYIYCAYTNSELENMENIPTIEEMAGRIGDVATPMTTTTTSYQLSVYNQTNGNCFYVKTTWVSVDGANHYISLLEADESHVDNTAHYALFDTAAEFSDSMQKLVVTYHCTRVDAYGMQQGNYYIPITYYAGVNTIPA